MDETNDNRQNEVDFQLPRDIEMEATIIKIECLENTGLRNLLYFVLSLLTGGFYYLLCRWIDALRIITLYRKCSLNEANYFMIYCKDGTKTVVQKVAREATIDEVVSLYSFIEFRLFKYYYNEKQSRFIAIDFELDGSINNEIHKKYCRGYQTQKEYSSARQMYGQNKTEIPEKTILQLLIDEILSPIYIFQLFSIILWFTQDYVVYTAVLLFISTVSVATSLYNAKKQSAKLKAIAGSTSNYGVYRCLPNNTDVNLQDITQFKQQLNASELVPGDLVQIEEKKPFPCDILLIQGECIVNEAGLTGESIPVIKTSLPDNLQKFDSADTNRISILYSGTLCLEVKQHKSRCVIGVVMKTGYNTKKGQLIRSILFPSQDQNKLYYDSMCFLGVIFVLAILGLIYAIIIQVRNGSELSKVALKALDVITIAVPPALPTCISLGISFALERLEKAGIFCISPMQINNVGKINIMCFDKTGTLTEDSLDMNGVVVSQKKDGKQPNFQDMIDHTKIREQGPQYRLSDYSDSLKVNDDALVLSHQIMSSCHSLSIYDNQLIGDPLDIKMFQSTGSIVDESHQLDDKFLTIIRQGQNHITQLMGTSDFDIGIIQRFEFSSKTQTMSVVIQNFDESFQRLHVKGAPEKIKSICNKDSLPDDFDQVLSYYSQRGLRVLGLATKDLKEFKFTKETSRDDLEYNLHFVGFMMMENKLKSVTTSVITTLHQANIETVMVTGDNILTAMSVALECGIMKKGQRNFVGQYQNKSIKWTEIVQPDDQKVKNVQQQKINIVPEVKNTDIDVLLQDDIEWLNLPKHSYNLGIDGQVFNQLLQSQNQSNLQF